MNFQEANETMKNNNIKKEKSRVQLGEGFLGFISSLMASQELLNGLKDLKGKNSLKLGHDVMKR